MARVQNIFGPIFLLSCSFFAVGLFHCSSRTYLWLTLWCVFRILLFFWHRWHSLPLGWFSILSPSCSYHSSRFFRSNIFLSSCFSFFFFFFFHLHFSIFTLLSLSFFRLCRIKSTFHLTTFCTSTFHLCLVCLFIRKFEVVETFVWNNG